MEPMPVDFLRWLGEREYRFVPPTPRTHAIVLARRRGEKAANLRDAFGWNLPFDETLLPSAEAQALAEDGWIRRDPAGWRAAFRVASIEERLYLHSPFPTDAADSVFFGPDTYRFLRFIRACAPPDGSIERICDFGTGSGVAALELARLFPGARVLGVDCNRKALDFARINAAHQKRHVEFCEASDLQPLTEPQDLIVMNPPFIADDGQRRYRDGGGAHGAEVTIRWAQQAHEKLRPRGRVLIYTGSAIVDGEDFLRATLQRRFGDSLRYEELDPDVFGEELERDAYEDVERIAVIGAVLTAR